MEIWRMWDCTKGEDDIMLDDITGDIIIDLPAYVHRR